MSDGDQQLALLHEHYKDTFAVIREHEKERDRLFLVLLALLGLLGVQIGYPADAGGLISNITAGPATVSESALPAAALLTATWALLFAISLRYAQRAITTERQYDYLHALEQHLAERLDAESVFERERAAYLRNYPAFSDWTWISYVVIFPVTVVLAVTGLMTIELTQLAYPIMHKVLDVAMAAAVIVSMYLYRLHPPTQILQRFKHIVEH